jgi:hypothetical protein
MTQQSGGGGTQTPPSFKGQENFRVTPETKPVDRTAIDNLLVRLIPTASNRPASPTDSWKPSRSQEPIIPQSGGAGGGTQTPPSFKGQENFRVTPETKPVDRNSIDSFVKSLLPSAANRTTSTQPSNNVPPPTASPSAPTYTPTTPVPSTVTDTTTAQTTVPAPATSITTAPSTSTVPVTATTVAPTIAPTVTPEVAPVTNPIVNNIVQTLVAAAAIGGGSKLLPGKKGGGGGGGGGAGGGMGAGPGSQEELKRQQQELDSKAKNWDLLIKNIWGKNVETLTK